MDRRELPKIQVWTDGSCNNNRKSDGGGIGIVMRFNENQHEVSEGPFMDSPTSASMEIMAVIRALEILSFRYNIIIHSDNQYVVNTYEKKWLQRWVKNGELGKRANGELWKRFDKIVSKHKKMGSRVKLCWVKGHNGNEYNEIADKLANEGRLNHKKIA